IVYLGVLSSLVTSFLSNYTLSRIEAFKMSAFNHVSTIVTMIAGVVILNESLAWYHLVGAVCIIIGVLGSNINLQKKKKHQKGTISMNK
ncbi:DMT family transporter, partial [Bacillus inaquosorum]